MTSNAKTKVESGTEHFPQVGVGVVVINKDEQVLLIRRGQEPNKGLWTIPGGRQEPGETLFETAHREILEETGVSISEPVLIDVVDLIRHDDQGMLIRHYTLVDYAAWFKDGTPLAGGDADLTRWVSVAAIADHVEWSETVRIVQEAAEKLSAID
ncbi:MAG: NUDIX domain-containing protein [Alphaproteobacteria bacterium]|nr:NUDIX domain-containing protein [Alphaproteobacteria bacterium]